MCGKPFEKTPSIREMRRFWKSAIMQRLYSLCKIVSLGQKLKFKKTCKNDSLITLELFCEKKKKKRLRKHQILEKWDDFENRPSCKGYSLCKMVSLGQKFKLKKKHAKKDSLITLEFFCEKNRLRKHQIFEKWDDFENRPSCMGYSLCKIVSFSHKLKLKKKKKKKHAKNDSLIILELFCAKNRLRKHQIFEKWDDFENRPSCKGYSKMVSLGQKLKFKETCEKRFFNHIRVVLCIKTAWENTEYWRNETILKIGHYP